MSDQFSTVRRRRTIRHLRATIETLAALTTSGDIRARLVFDRRYLEQAEQQLHGTIEPTSETAIHTRDRSVDALIDTVKAHVKILGFLLQEPDVVLAAHRLHEGRNWPGRSMEPSRA